MAGSNPGERPRQPKTDGPRAGRSITVRPPLWRSLAGRLSLAAVSLGLLVVAAIALVIGQVGRAVTHLERGVYAQLATDARLRLDRLTSRDRTRLMEAAFTDELYQSLERGPAPPDSFVRPRFAERFVNLHGDRYIGLYSLGGQRLFFYGDSADAALQQAATSNALLRTLDNREPTVGLLRVGDRLMWVAGAPVLPTNYADASQPIRGYLVVAQPFTPTMLSAGTARLELAAMGAPTEPFRTQVATAGGDSVRVEFAIPDVFAQQTTLASLTTSRGEFGALDSTFQGLWAMALLLGLAVAASLWVVATRLLVSPTIKTSAALAPVHRGELPNLVNAPSGLGEWTTIVGAINRLITNGRTQADRFQRMTAVVDDGAFERDLTSREWTGGARLLDLLGARPDESLPELFQRAFHPDDAPEVLAWLTADAPSPRRLSVEVRFRRGSSDPWTAGRLQAEVGTDLAGQPNRITGRLRDVSAEQLLAERDHRAQAADAARSTQLGTTLRSLASALRDASHSATLGDRLDWIGRALTGAVAPGTDSFDLLALLQQAAGTDPAAAELLIVPGVPNAVIGDRDMTQRLVDELFAAVDRSAGRPTLRAEQPDKTRPDLIRIVAESRQGAPNDALQAWLERGEMDQIDRGAGPLVVHHLARALGGRAGTGREGDRTQLWFEIPLAAAPTPQVEAPSWETEAGAVAVFDTSESEPTAPTSDHAAPSSPPELVADATVVIDFDAPPKAVQAPIGPRVTAALARRDPAVVRMARIALADTPIRITELRGAIRAGESRTVSQIAQTVVTIADALEAAEMARRCRDILDAVEGQYLESADYLVQSLDVEWARVQTSIAPLVPTAERRSAASPIDAVTLEQLTATTTSDGLGLGNQLIGLFLAEAPARVDSAERAAERGDLATFKAAASDLKGMCGLIGAAHLGELCQVAVDTADLTAATASVTGLRTELRLVQEVLEPLLGVRAGA